MDKETFIKRMSLIQNFHSEQETVSVLIEKIIDGYAVVRIGDYLIQEMIKIISEWMEIEDDDLLEWWLYEDVNKVIYIQDERISVKTLDELYDYIVSQRKTTI
jgi:hypothetical protein